MVAQKVIDMLRTYSYASLQQMARQHDSDTKQRKKEPLVKALAPLLENPKAIKASLDDLEPVERLLLDRLILAGGAMPTALLRQQLEQENQVDPTAPSERNPFYGYGRQAKGSVRNRGSRKFEDVLARLGALGLVFTADPIQSSGSMVELNRPGRRLLIPDGIMRRIPAVTMAVETTPEPAATHLADPASLLRDVYLLLSFAAREPIPLTTRGLIPKRTLVQIDSTLQLPEGAADVRSEEDLERLPFMRALTEELGLLVSGAGKLLLDEQAEAFLRESAGERQQRLFDAWRNTLRWNELFRIPNILVKGKGMSVRSAAPGVATARQRVLKEMAELPVGAWITLSDLVQRLRVRAYEFLLPRDLARDRYAFYAYYSYSEGVLPNPYLGGNDLGLTFEVQHEDSGWNVIEAGFICAIVAEPLHTLGIVDIGGDEASITAFRITEAGARLLRGEKPPSPPDQPNVIVQPNFQIIVLQPTGEDVLFRLDQMADRLRVDQAIEYELTRESVYRAQQAGLDADAIIAFLTSVSTVEIPRNVQRTVEEWGLQHERITVRQRTPLLHVIDEETLDRLYDDAEIAQLLGRKVAPTVALVPRQSLQQLFTGLIQRKLLPALSEGSDGGSVPLLDADPTGRLALRQPLPSIFDLHTLREFANEEENGALQLSPESLRRGARNGTSADAMLATLERLHAGPVPPEVTALVRKWARDWGHGALFDATILQVEKPETLTDLLADPEVRPSLETIPGAPTLALVRGDAVARVRALLEERGMTLGDRSIR